MFGFLFGNIDKEGRLEEDSGLDIVSILCLYK